MTASELLVLQTEKKDYLNFVIELSECKNMEEVEELRKKYLALAKSSPVSEN